MKALIDGLVYLVVALAYLVYEVLRIIFSALRPAAQQAAVGGAPMAAKAPTRPAGAPAPQVVVGDTTAVKISRAEPDPNQIPLFDGSESLRQPVDRVQPCTKVLRKAMPTPSVVKAATPAPSTATPSTTDEPPPTETGKRPERKAAQHKDRWVGVLEDFGVGTFTDTKSKGASPDKPRKYQSFFVSIETEDGGLVSKQGVELEKAIESSGAKAGDTVELLFLGKERVEVEENGEKVPRYRNRWRIKII